MTKQKKKINKKMPVILIIVIVLLIIFSLLFAPKIVDQSHGILYPLNYYSIVTQYSEEYGLDPYLVMALIRTESNFDPSAVSEAGAIGLAQIMPDTGQWLSEKMDLSPYSEEMLYIPETSIQLCCYYLNFLLECYGNMDTALAAYNAGMGNVSSWLEDPSYSEDGVTLRDIPYTETRNYVQRINDAHVVYVNLYMEDDSTETAG